MTTLIRAIFALCRQVHSMRAVGDTPQGGLAQALCNAAVTLGTLSKRARGREHIDQRTGGAIVGRKNSPWLIQWRSRQ